MATYKKTDDVIIITAASDIEAGGVVNVGSKIGVAHAPIASGAIGAVAIRGIYEFACGAAIAQGAEVYLDASGVATTSSAGLAKAGFATTAGTNGGVIEVAINE